MSVVSVAHAADPASHQARLSVGPVTMCAMSIRPYPRDPVEDYTSSVYMPVEVAYDGAPVAHLFADDISTLLAALDLLEDANEASDALGWEYLWQLRREINSIYAGFPRTNTSD